MLEIARRRIARAEDGGTRRSPLGVEAHGLVEVSVRAATGPSGDVEVVEAASFASVAIYSPPAARRHGRERCSLPDI
jgi:hypothetical protein